MRARIALSLIALAAGISLAHALWVGVVTDDAGIALAYARTFVSGQGLRLTPLSPRVEAYSDPLWVLWLALGYLLRVGGPAFSHVSGAFFGAAAVLLTGLVPSLAEGRARRLLDVVPPWVLAFDTTYNYWTGAGLETGAFALALTAMLALLANGSRWSAAPAGLLAVLRPEGALYVVLAAPFKGQPERSGRRYAMDLCQWLALAALPGVAWLLFRLAYYGQWLPNSFFAKRGWQYGGLAYLNAWFVQDPWHWALCLSPVVLLSRRTRRSGVLAYSACAASIIFVLVSHGDWMDEHRFAAHALPAAALAAGLVPAALDDLFGRRRRYAGVLAAVALVAAAFSGARARSPGRRLNPELPLTYLADQGRWFRDEARRLQLLRPRIAHFDIGGLALESGAEVIDLAGLGDLYIGRVGYQAQQAVRDYLFEDVKPHMLNIHGPCEYLRNDPRLWRDYLRVASGAWGENWVRKPLVLGLDDRCPSGRVPAGLAERLSKATPAEARDLWLCARAHLKSPPDVSALAQHFADRGLREEDGARDLLDAAVTLDPTQIRAAQRLLQLRLQR